MRSWKKLFQSITTEEAGGLDVPALVAGVGSEVAVVETLRTRHSEGVKNEEGVEVAVGGLAANAENFDLDRQGRVV